jgi:hypothetical protein
LAQELLAERLCLQIERRKPTGNAATVPTPCKAPKRFWPKRKLFEAGDSACVARIMVGQREFPVLTWFGFRELMVSFEGNGQVGAIADAAARN